MRRIAQAEAQKIFGPKNKPALNQQALQAAILAMQDEKQAGRTSRRAIAAAGHRGQALIKRKSVGSAIAWRRPSFSVRNIYTDRFGAV